MTGRQIAEAMAKHTVEQLSRTTSKEDFERCIADALQVVAEEETKREREACAKIADEEANHPDGDSAGKVAERIRARST